MRPWLRLAVQTFGLICLAALVSLLVCAGLWYGRGGRILSVQSGSMTPTFKAGDGLLVKPVDVAALKPGDVVSYRSLQQPTLVISHRVVSIAPEGTPVTKGDALKQIDPAVRPTQIIGQATAVAPYFGRLVNWLRTPLGLTVGVYVPAVLVVSSVFVLLVARYRPGVQYRAPGHRMG